MQISMFFHLCTWTFTVKGVSGLSRCSFWKDECTTRGKSWMSQAERTRHHSQTVSVAHVKAFKLKEQNYLNMFTHKTHWGTS